MVEKYGGEVWCGSMMRKNGGKKKKIKKCVSVILSTLVDSFSVSSIRDNKRRKKKKNKVFFFSFLSSVFCTLHF